MRLATAIWFFVAFSLILAVALTTTLIFQHHAHDRALVQLRLSDTIQATVSQLSALSAEYAQHPNQRIAQQWEDQRQKLGKSVTDLSSTFDGKPVAVIAIEQSTAKLDAAFMRLQNIQSMSPAPPNEVRDRAISLLVGQLSSVLQEASADVTKLTNQAGQKVEAAFNLGHNLTLAVAVMVSLIVIGMGFIVFRSVLRPVISLKKAVTEIGSGAFDAKLSLGGAQEIQEIGEAVNEMAINLKTLDSIRAAKIEAEAASSAKSNFLTSMSHELRTPLNAILGFSQILNTPNNNLSPKEREYADHIFKSGTHLLALINDVLDLAKIEADKLELKLEDIPVETILAPTLVMANTLAEQKGVRLKRERRTAPIAIKGDLISVRQVLINLLSNAINYNHRDGSVTLAYEPLDFDWVRFYVIDTGPGIAPKDQEHLFKPFNRLTPDRTTTEGTGVGLAITKELVTRMGGRIGMKSDLGKGATFWFDLPLVKEDALLCYAKPVPDTIDAQEQSTANPPARSPRRLLYVEDNVSNADLMRAIFTARPDFKIDVVATAEEGLETLRKREVDLVLMDLNLAGMDGYEATKRMKADDALAQIPVIAVTANAMLPLSSPEKLAVFAHYITKPFDVAKIFGVVEQVLSATDTAARN